MKITDPFIRRPVLALVINLLIIIAGLQAVRSLNVRQYPRSDNAVGNGDHGLCGGQCRPGTRVHHHPLERAIAAADGIDYIQSQSALGRSTISARLKLNYDPIKALSEISSKSTRCATICPRRPKCPVINVESADSQFASAYLSFTSDVLNRTKSPTTSCVSCSRDCPP
jgi:multidrug efflux pump